MEFRAFRGFCAESVSKIRPITAACAQIPFANRTGNGSAEQGICRTGRGEIPLADFIEAHNALANS
jgi:hypothetical protein